MSQDILPIKGYDHVEFYVGNAKQSAHFYEKALGFQPVAKCGLETGVRDRATYVMQQGNVRILLTTALTPDHEIARHCMLHGDGVKAIGLSVADVEAAVSGAHARGATVIQKPTATEDQNGVVVTGTIKYAGDTIFRFVDRTRYRGVFMPGYQAISIPPTPGVGLAAIDHIVTNVYLGEMNYWAKWFEDVMGFANLIHFTEKDISTEYSALMSKVMENGSGKVKFPINEPAEGKRRSQIEEYLDFYYGQGVQHIAIATGDICQTVRAMRSRNIDFLRVPDTYYEDLPDRIGAIAEDYKELRELGILVDKDDDGYLLQIFTQPMQDRPTLFFEVIERHGCRGFGQGNFKALFVSIEREQARRGNL